MVLYRDQNPASLLLNLLLTFQWLVMSCNLIPIFIKNISKVIRRLLWLNWEFLKNFGLRAISEIFTSFVSHDQNFKIFIFRLKVAWEKISTIYDFKIPSVIFITSGLVQALKHNVQLYENDINWDVFLLEIEIAKLSKQTQIYFTSRNF